MRVAAYGPDREVPWCCRAMRSRVFVVYDCAVMALHSYENMWLLPLSDRVRDRETAH